MTPSFSEMIRSSYDFKADDYLADPRWALLESLYLANYVHGKPFERESIPHTIHQIWLGSDVPQKYVEWMASWHKLNPTWEYHLWTEEDLLLRDDMMPVEQWKVFNTIANVGQRSDFLRYNLLNQFGGVYVDTDFECLKSFDSLTHLDFFTGVGYPSRPELYIGLIGSTPHHSIIEHVVNSMTEIKQNGWKEIFETTGSYFFTKNFFEIVQYDSKGVVAFPHPYFYPFPNQAGHEKRNGRDFIQECSYAVHHWEVAWAKK